MKKYLWVPAVLLLVGGFAAFLDFGEPHGQGDFGGAGTRAWLAEQWYWIALVCAGLMLCVLLVDDVVSYFERRSLDRRNQAR
jgi:hypothetical protein